MILKDGAKLNLNSVSYQVKRKIGKGGFGSVYEVQEEASLVRAPQVHIIHPRHSDNMCKAYTYVDSLHHQCRPSLATK